MRVIVVPVGKLRNNSSVSGIKRKINVDGDGETNVFSRAPLVYPGPTHFTHLIK